MKVENSTRLRITLANGGAGIIVEGSSIDGETTFADGAAYRTCTLTQGPGRLTLFLRKTRSGEITLAESFARIDSDDPIIEAGWTRITDISIV